MVESRRHVAFELNSAGIEDGHQVCLVGSAPELGAWAWNACDLEFVFLLPRSSYP